MTLQEWEHWGPRLKCPLCGAQDFDPKLRCDPGHVPCWTAVRCQRCGHEFDAEEILRLAQSEGPEGQVCDT